jgi:hypothetical protein
MRQAARCGTVVVRGAIEDAGRSAPHWSGKGSANRGRKSAIDELRFLKKPATSEVRAATSKRDRAVNPAAAES